jgi:hypothetical protein
MCTGCRARSCAERGERSSERARTCTSLSASPGVPGAGREGARARPMSVLDGMSRLVELDLDGGEWGLLARGLAMASPRSFRPMGVCPGHAGKRGKGQGEV